MKKNRITPGQRVAHAVVSIIGRTLLAGTFTVPATLIILSMGGHW